uniref:Uncharacterized protein n=1 Tax=Anguilla anguilla TaxID=7936 RepID=A0A0E9SIZ2_ANGAN
MQSTIMELQQISCITGEILWSAVL